MHLMKCKGKVIRSDTQLSTRQTENRAKHSMVLYLIYPWFIKLCGELSSFLLIGHGLTGSPEFLHGEQH